MKYLIACLLFTSLSANGQGFMDEFAEEESAKNEAGIATILPEKKVNISPQVAGGTAEQNIFYDFLNRGEYRKALFQWNSAFQHEEMGKSATGVALLGFLEFKNGLKISGIETLLNIKDPSKISQDVQSLWRTSLAREITAWSFVETPWKPEWQGIMPLHAEVMLRTRDFKSMTQAEVKALLGKTKVGSDIWASLMWQNILAQIDAGDEVAAAKGIKSLMKTEQKRIPLELLNITVARIMYQKGHLAHAQKYYKKIGKNSPLFFVAREELAWAYLRRGEPQNADAITRGLVNQSFIGEVGAESYYLHSLTNLKVCDYVSVATAVGDFKKRFRPRAVMLTEMSKSPKTSHTSRLAKLMGNEEFKFTDMGPVSNHVPNYSFNDYTLKFRARRMAELAKETEIAGKLFTKSLSESSASIGFQGSFDHLKNKMAQRYTASESLVYERFRELAKIEIADIKKILHKMQIVEAEVVQQLALVDRVLKEGNVDKKIYKGKVQESSKYSMKFPYDGEIWFDELDKYKVNLKGGCRARDSATL